MLGRERDQIFGLGVGGWDFSGEAAKKYAPQLAHGDVMAEFLRKIRSGSGAAKDLDPFQRSLLEGNLRAAFPESFKPDRIGVMEINRGQMDLGEHEEVSPATEPARPRPRLTPSPAYSA